MPSSNQLLIRPRIMDKLFAIHHTKIFFVSAPTGYGKTVAVKQFVETTDNFVIWHTLRPDEQEVTNLYKHAIKRLESICEGISTDLPSPDRYGGGELASLITAHLEDNVETDLPYIYVLDDLQIASSPAAQAWIYHLAKQFPLNGRLVLISQELPPIPYFLKSKQQIAGIGIKDLAMNKSEVLSLVPHSEELYNSLAEQLNGWPAAINLLADFKSDDILGEILGLDGSPEEAFKFLANQVFENLPIDLQEFLLVSSILTTITPDGCRVVELTEWKFFLEEVYRRNLFITETPEGIVYHALWRSFLQEKFQATDEAQFKFAHERVAEWLEKNDAVELAFNHLIAAEAFELAAALADRFAPDLFRQGKLTAMQAWLQVLAEQGVSAPYLSFETAISLFDKYCYDEAQILLQSSSESFTGRGDQIGLALVKTSVAMIEVRQGKSQVALDQLQPFLKSEQIKVRSRALRYSGLAYFSLGDIDKAIVYLEEAAQIYRDLKLKLSLAVTLQDLGVVYTQSGELSEATPYLTEVVNLYREFGNTASLALALNNLAYHAHQQSDYHLAIYQLRDGLNIIEGQQDDRAHGYLSWSLGDVYRDIAQYDHARKYYEMALDVTMPQKEPHLYVNILISYSTLERRVENYNESLLWAEKSVSVPNVPVLDSALAQATILLAAAASKGSKTEEIFRELDEIVNYMFDQKSHLCAAGILGACLAILPHNARERLTKAKQAIQIVGSSQPFVAEIATNEAAISYLVLSADTEIDEGLKTLKRAKNANTPITFYDDNRARFVRAITFDKSIVELDGKLIPKSAWRFSVQAKELFFHLMFVPQDRKEISLMYWADKDAETGRSNFYTLLNHIKNAVGDDTIISRDGIYRVNPTERISCDAHDFEQLIIHSKADSHNLSWSEETLLSAIKLYQGDFLPNIGWSWVISRREQYARMYIGALRTLGYYAVNRGDYDGALYRYNTALIVDPVREDVHRDIIKMWGGLGESGKLIQHYNEMREILNEELGIQPSEKTINLVNSYMT